MFDAAVCHLQKRRVFRCELIPGHWKRFVIFGCWDGLCMVTLCDFGEEAQKK